MGTMLSINLEESNVHACMLSCFSCVHCDPMDCVAQQAPLSMGFSQQGYWSWLPCLPPEDLPIIG